MLVAHGDTPLLRGDSLRAFAQEHEAAQSAVSVLSGVVDNPYGYGRIVRNDEGDVEAIVEERDATPEQRGDPRDQLGDLRLRRRVPRRLRCPASATTTPRASTTSPTPSALARDAGLTVGAFPLDDVIQTEGANDRVQLANLGHVLNRRILERWMREASP